MQDDQLFAGSIAGNIDFFDPEMSAAHIEVAARMAAIHDDIEAMPMGYQSLVGDMGSNLSGGQKQRVILARRCIGDRGCWCWMRQPVIWMWNAND